MFGIFRKKTDMQQRIEARINLVSSLQDKDPTGYAKASNTIWPFLLKTFLLQLKMTGEDEGIFAKNSFCLGYLFGATESMIQSLVILTIREQLLSQRFLSLSLILPNPKQVKPSFTRP